MNLVDAREFAVMILTLLSEDLQSIFSVEVVSETEIGEFVVVSNDVAVLQKKSNLTRDSVKINVWFPLEVNSIASQGVH